jgi:hypothetical protein
MTKGFPNGKPQIVFSIPKGTQNGTRARKGWKELEPYLDKELSPLLEDVTPEQLSALLRGLHLGDGSKYRGDKWNQASYHIFTGRKVFAERLQSLCVRRGFRCNLSIRQAAPGRKEGYTLHIKKTNAWSLCGNKKMIGRSHMSPSKNIEHERVWCVENDLGTLVTRRRGKVAVVGNCIGRMIRIGSQHDRCYAIHLVASGTIDEDVIVTLKKKMKLVEKIMGKRLKGEKDQDAVIEAENDISDLFDSVRANARTRKYK